MQKYEHEQAQERLRQARERGRKRWAAVRTSRRETLHQRQQKAIQHLILHNKEMQRKITR